MAYLYVARGRNDLIKVGRTSSLAQRQQGLRKEFKRYGNELLELQCIADLSDESADAAERRLIDKIKDVFTAYAGREWFTGSFEKAIEAAKIAAEEGSLRRPYAKPIYRSPEQIEEIRLRNEAHKLAVAESRAAYKRAKDARRALRELRRAEIAARAA